MGDLFANLHALPSHLKIVASVVWKAVSEAVVDTVDRSCSLIFGTTDHDGAVDSMKSNGGAGLPLDHDLG